MITIIVGPVIEVRSFEVPRFAMRPVEPLAVSFGPSAEPREGRAPAGRRQGREEIIVEDLGVAPRRHERRDR